MSALAQERSYIRSVGDEPLPGYRLIAPLGMGGFGEVWKCVAPGGLHKAIKFVGEDPEAEPGEQSSLEQEYEAFERVKVIRHPFLLTLERVELIGGELVMVMELADRSLAHRYNECRDAGGAGIPRTELLSYMVDAAEALDVLGREHGLQHLDVKPANLFLLGGHVKVGDYGLVARHKTSLAGEEPKLGRGLTPKYVAPEILSDRVHARSDQYPLALVYQELLTGVFPYAGRTARQLILQHTSAEPDLTALPPKDRAAVGQALSKDPAARFSTCLSFVKALLSSGDTKDIGAIVRTRPAQSPAHEVQVPVSVPPSARTSASTGIEATLRTYPTVANWPDGPGHSEHAQEFNRAHHGLTYVGEAPSTPRGRVVRAADAAGAFHLVHFLKIPPDCASECEPIAGALAKSAGRAVQAVFRPHPGSLNFAVPEGYPSLKEFLARRKATDEPALRRSEIREILAPIADTLDSLHGHFGFAHGLLSPTTVIRNGAAWGVTLFGIGELLGRTRADHDWIQTELYTAPEAACGRAMAESDQYSLALIFLELAGAWSPPDRRSPRSDRSTLGFRFNRDALLECESAAVKKAMATRPDSRFRTCAEFLAALDPPASAGIILDEVLAVECLYRLAGKPAAKGAPPRPEHLTDALLRGAGALAVVSWPSAESDGLVVKLPDGRFTCRFPVRLSADLALLKLQAFRDQHGLKLVKWTDDAYALKPPRGPQGTAGKGIEMVVEMPKGEHVGASELAVTCRAVGGAERGRADEQIVLLIEQFRRTVQNTTERRRASRFPTEMPILAYPIDDELRVLTPILGTCRDVSGTGFSCTLSGHLAASHAFVTFPTVADFGRWALLAKVVRTQSTPAGALIAGRFVHTGV